MGKEEYIALIRRVRDNSEHYSLLRTNDPDLFRELTRGMDVVLTGPSAETKYNEINEKPIDAQSEGGLEGAVRGK